VSENHGFAVALREGSAPDWQGRTLGPDPYRSYAESVEAVLAAFAQKGVLNRQVTIREFGTFPAGFAARMHLVDSVAHGWDLAKTFGLPYEPDEEAVADALAFAAMIPADPEGRRSRGTFDVVVETPDNASPLDRSSDWSTGIPTGSRPQAPGFSGLYHAYGPEEVSGHLGGGH